MTDHWREIDEYLRACGIKVGEPTLGGTTGGKHAAGSLHYLGRARDYGQARNDMRGILRALEPYALCSPYFIEELFGLDVYIDRGRRFSPSASLRAGHQDHVHAGLSYHGTVHFGKQWRADLTAKRLQEVRVPPQYEPPLGPIAAVWRDDRGCVVAAASPDGDVYAWGVEWKGNVRGRPYWGNRKVAAIGPPVNPTKAYRIQATDGGFYELPDDQWLAEHGQ